MLANTSYLEASLVDRFVAWLRERLPETWQVESPAHQASGSGDVQQMDNVVSLRTRNGLGALLAVEASTSFEPREISRLLPGFASSLRAISGNVPLVVVAPWLSPRSQELLAEQQINYLDLTGNALIKLDSPALFIQSAGAARNPHPRARGAAGLSGPKAARLIRLLADFRPPYGVRELARSAELTPGYVSRLLDTLDRDAIVQRGRRGSVADVDVQALLRAWADTYDVLRTNDAVPMLARNGAADALRRLSTIEGTAVTGAFAAARLAPIAAPMLLLAYCTDVERTGQQLGLLPTDEAANVVLLRPFDHVVWARSSRVDAITYCAPSQVAVDCLTGNGRMPAEGEALLRWMTEDQSRWRAASLQQAPTT